jgi:hypothetical protein
MLDTIQSRSSNGFQSSRFENYIRSDPENNTGVAMLPSYASKGVVIYITARDQCCTPFRGEPAFDYTPDKPFRSSDILSARSKIYFEKSSFHLSNSDPNVKPHIATHNLIAWTARTMKDNLVNFETRFKHCLFLEDKDPIPEYWKRLKFKELVTSEYGEQLERYNQMKWNNVYNNKPDGGNFPIKYLHFQNDISRLKIHCIRRRRESITFMGISF